MLEIGPGVAASRTFTINLDPHGWRCGRPWVAVHAQSLSDAGPFSLPRARLAALFVLGGVDRWRGLRDAPSWPESRGAAAGRARSSTLLSSGRAARRRRKVRRGAYRDGPSQRKASADPRGLRLQASTCLAGGLFSPPIGGACPFRVDAKVLANLPLAALTSAFQVTDSNPLLGP